MNSKDCTSSTFSITGPAEPVRPVRPWSVQKSLYLWSKPCIFRVLVGPIIVKLRFFLNGRTNLVLLPPPLHNHCTSIYDKFHPFQLPFIFMELHPIKNIMLFCLYCLAIRIAFFVIKLSGLAWIESLLSFPSPH